MWQLIFSYVSVEGGIKKQKLLDLTHFHNPNEMDLSSPWESVLLKLD